MLGTSLDCTLSCYTSMQSSLLCSIMYSCIHEQSLLLYGRQVCCDGHCSIYDLCRVDFVMVCRATWVGGAPKFSGLESSTTTPTISDITVAIWYLTLITDANSDANGITIGVWYQPQTIADAKICLWYRNCRAMCDEAYGT